jgi:hypothetical protein
VVVVHALVQFEHGGAAFEVVASHETCRFELGQDAVHRCKPDVLVEFEQATINPRRSCDARWRSPGFRDLGAAP